jgi:hypothetical protein
VKENEVWQLAQLNFSASPFDNPIMQGIQNRIILFSVIALLVGWVIGFFVGRRSKKSA